MFQKIDIEAIKKDMEKSLKEYIDTQLKVLSKDLNFGLVKDLENLKERIDLKLNSFQREISDKYISAIEKVLMTSKESMFIDTILKQVDDKSLANLKRVVMQPILEERWKEDLKEKSIKVEENVVSKGEQLILKRKQLHDEFLVKEREGKKEEASILKAKLEMLDLVLEVKK